MEQRVKHSKLVILKNCIKAFEKYESIPIEQFEKMMEECKEKGVTHLSLEADIDYYYDEVNGIEISAEIRTLETFEEMQTRVELEERNRRFQEDRNKKLLEDKERETLAKLKEKYETRN